MDIFKANFLINCKKVINETNYFENFDHKFDLQQIIVANNPWDDSVITIFNLLYILIFKIYLSV